MAKRTSQADREAAADKREGGAELPEHLRDPGPLPGATGLTEAMTYGPGGALAREADGDGDEGPDYDGTVDPDAEEPPAEGDDKGEAATGKDAGDDDPNATGAGQEPKPKTWDADRQRIDQENATLRRENAALRDDVKAIRDRLEEVAAGKAGDGTGQQTDQQLKDLVELDEFATDDDRTAAVNELIRRDKLRARRDEARDEALTETQQQGVNRKAFDVILADGERKYGKEHRNEVITRIQALWKESGFDEDQYPDPASTRAAVMGIFAEVAAEAKAAPTPSTKTRRTPAHDTGGGGGRSVSSRKGAGMETLADAIADMKSAGRLR